MKLRDNNIILKYRIIRNGIDLRSKQQTNNNLKNRKEHSGLRSMTLRRQRQKDHDLEAGLGYRLTCKPHGLRQYLNKQKIKKILKSTKL